MEISKNKIEQKEVQKNEIKNGGVASKTKEPKKMSSRKTEKEVK